MSDPSYKYYGQQDFTGGICTEPELRRTAKSGEVTVAEAADVWAPNGVLTRRPGVYGTPAGYVDSAQISSATPAQLSAAIVVNKSTGAVITPTVTGTELFFSSLSNGSSFIDYILYTPLLINSATPLVKYTTVSVGGGSVARGIVEALVWTPPGVSAYPAGEFVDSGDPTVLVTVLGGTYACPLASIPSTGTLWARVDFRVIGAPMTLYLINAAATAHENLFNTTNGFQIAGATSAVLPNNNEVYISATFANVANDPTVMGFTVTQVPVNTTLSPFTLVTINTIDPTLNKLSNAAPPCFAAVPDANRVYIAYSNQIFEYRPELAVPIRKAQVNSAQEITGSIEGTPSPFSPTFVAQFQSFPYANQLCYFNGLLFMTDIKGAPNVVQWGGPALAGAVDVLPVLSFALVGNSQDNSPNVGFGVYNQNLYVFKKNSIWALVPAGQSTVDGSYLFTSKLVTSGAGCSSARSIVSTPAGIIYYNSGGFYIFDGVRTSKISSPVKHLVDAISPGSAFQMQATHWAQQHCYVLSVNLSPPWHSTSFAGLPGNFPATIVYDYQNNAWWLWLSVTGNSLFVNSLNQLMSQSFVGEYRILDPNKQFDSDVGAKAAATPYFKTQRFGFGESVEHNYGEIRIRGEIDSLSYAMTQTPNDQLPANAQLTTAISMYPPNYAPIGQTTLIPDGAVYSPPWGRRETHLNLNNTNTWTQVSIAGSYGPFTVYGLELGYMQDGR